MLKATRYIWNYIILYYNAEVKDFWLGEIAATSKPDSWWLKSYYHTVWTETTHTFPCYTCTEQGHWKRTDTSGWWRNAAIKMSIVVNKTSLILTPPPFFPSWCYLIFKWSFKQSNRVTSSRPCYPVVDSFTCTLESFMSDRYLLFVLRSSFLWLAALPIKRQFRASWKCDTLASTYSSLTTPSHGMQLRHA